MNIDLIVGGFLVALGAYSTFARFFAPHRLGKLEPMKKRWGKTGGALIHIFAYTVLPFVMGGLVLFSQLSE